MSHATRGQALACRLMMAGGLVLFGSVAILMTSTPAVAGDFRSASGRVASTSANQRTSAVAVLASESSSSFQANVATPVPAATLATAGEVVVRLYPRAVVDADVVTLADVADVQGEAGQLMASWAVANAPQPGGSCVVELEKIQKILAARRANLSTWFFRGASRCTVSRPVERESNATPEADVKVPSDVTSPLGEKSLIAMSQRQAVNPNTLEGAIREHLSARLSSLGGEPVISFGNTNGKLLSLSRKTYQFDIVARGERLTGLVPLEITISENGTIKQVMQVAADVRIKKAVIVAARPLNQGETLRENDLTTKEQVYDSVDKIGLTDGTPLIGQRVKKFIDAGSELSPKDVEPMPLVNRNELVTVWASRGNVRVKSVAKAMKAGSYGEQIMVKNESSRETFNVVITGPQTVELVNGIGLMQSQPAIVVEK